MRWALPGDPLLLPLTQHSTHWGSLAKKAYSTAIAKMATMLASKTVFAARLSSVQAKRPTAPRAVLGAPAFLSGAALGPRQQTSHSMR